MGQFLQSGVPALTQPCGLLVPRVATLGCFSAMFLFCSLKKDNSHIDTWWGLSFVVPNLLILALRSRAGHKLDARTLAVNTLVTLWGARLAYHIAKRHKEEDYRYADMRNRWRKLYGSFGFYLTVFIYIFMLQYFFSLVVNNGAMFISANSAGQALGLKDLIGLGIGYSGLLIESVADYQLRRHIENPDPKKGKFCQTGLWQYSRHPNYFGEILVWWGVYIAGLSVPGGWAYIHSPLVITWLLRYFSGVPLLEKKQSKHPEWEAYAKKTPMLIPFWHGQP